MVAWEHGGQPPWGLEPLVSPRCYPTTTSGVSSPWLQTTMEQLYWQQLWHRVPGWLAYHSLCVIRA